MTVSATTTTNSYSGDGSTTEFSFTFEILTDADIKVIVVTDSTGAESVKTLSTDYAVTGAALPAGGTVTFTTAPASGETVFLLRNMNITQPTDYTANDPFPAETHENALDRMTLQIQQVNQKLSKALTRPDSDGASTDLPQNLDLKGKIL